MTLLFGFLPYGGSIEVIGVGWFIGTVFVFYLVFPAFCVAVRTRLRAWVALAIALAWNAACAFYFECGPQNILYSFCFFVVGALVWHYSSDLRRAPAWILALASLAAAALYCVVGGNTLACLLCSACFLAYAVSAGETVRKLDWRRCE